jgi:hypothetical protein
MVSQAKPLLLLSPQMHRHSVDDENDRGPNAKYSKPTATSCIRNRWLYPRAGLLRHRRSPIVANGLKFSDAEHEDAFLKRSNGPATLTEKVGSVFAKDWTHGR